MSGTMKTLVVVSGIVLFWAVIYFLMVPGAHPSFSVPVDDKTSSLGSLPLGADPLTEAEWTQFSDSVEQFTQDLFHTMSDEKENLFFSPSSLTMSLGVLYLGADGATQEALARALHLNGMPREKVATGFSQMMENIYLEPGDVELHMVNQLWVDSSFPVYRNYLDWVKHFFTSSVHQVDLRHQPEASRQKINQEIEERTRHTIKNLLPERSLDKSTRMIITNAIYFKALWYNPFDKDTTQTEPFHLLSGQTVDVPMMTQLKRKMYATNDIFQAVRVPYQGDDFEMVVYLPHDAQQFDYSVMPNPSALEWELSHVELKMPQFSIRSALDMQSVLSRLGLADMFGDKCNLENISQFPLFVKKVFHEAFISVDENGTEAAGATAVIINQKSLPMNVKEVYLDKPFLFTIRHVPSEATVFSGVLKNPQ